MGAECLRTVQHRSANVGLRSVIRVRHTTTCLVSAPPAEEVRCTTDAATSLSAPSARIVGVGMSGVPAPRETACAVRATSAAIGQMSAVRRSIDEALTEGPGSDMGPGLGNMALLTLTFTPVCAVPLTMSVLMVLCLMMMLFLTRPTLILMI